MFRIGSIPRRPMRPNSWTRQKLLNIAAEYLLNQSPGRTLITPSCPTSTEYLPFRYSITPPLSVTEPLRSKSEVGLGRSACDDAPSASGFFPVPARRHTQHRKYTPGKAETHIDRSRWRRNRVIFTAC